MRPHAQIGRFGTIAGVVAVLLVPALVAVATESNSPVALREAPAHAPEGGTAAVAPSATVSAPAPTSTSDTPAAPFAPAADAAPELVEASGVTDAAATGPGTQDLAASFGAADEAGSSEVKTVKRSCGAKKDTHYDPPEGKGLSACRTNGKHDNSKKYTARHFTDNVTCGTRKAPAPPVAGVHLNGEAKPSATTSEWWLQVCSDELPVQGRTTVGGTATSNAAVTTFIVFDGDRDNPVEHNPSWIRIDMTFGSFTTGSPRCGNAYDDGGRGDSDNPGGDDIASRCIPS